MKDSEASSVDRDISPRRSPRHPHLRAAASAAPRRDLQTRGAPREAPARAMGRFGDGKRLLEVLFPLANYGVGSRVTRSTWHSPNCFWEVTRVKYNKRAAKDDGAIGVGKAWGTLHWNGEPRGRPDRKIPAPAKARWQLFGDAPPPPTDAERPPLATRLHKKYFVVA